MKTCFNCFLEYEDNYSMCPYCGYDPAADTTKFHNALPHGTPLGGKYIIGRVLGQGGFGITYLAKDFNSGELVAIKEYFPDSMATRGEKNRIIPFTGTKGENFEYGKASFMEEAKTLARFNSIPNIVSVYSYFEENSTAYFAMEYLRGRNLKEYISENGGRLSWQQAERVLLPILDALEAVHSQGMVHRDIKPDNILITADGTPKLLDFGSARFSLGEKSSNLSVVITQGFAPYEQYKRHGKQGPYTDIYAIAATMYYSVTGKVPPESIDRRDDDSILMPNALGVAVTPEK